MHKPATGKEICPYNARQGASITHFLQPQQKYLDLLNWEQISCNPQAELKSIHDSINLANLSSCYFFYFSTVTFFLLLFFLLLFFLLPHCYFLSCYFFSCYFFSYFPTVTFFPVTFFAVTFFAVTFFAVTFFPLLFFLLLSFLQSG